MHRLIRDRLEEVLAESKPHEKNLGAAHLLGEVHLKTCAECRAEIAAMRQQAAAIRELRAPASRETEPREGFYARVIERIEAQGGASIWNLFFESPFGRRIAVASTALALLLGLYLIGSERTAEPYRNSSAQVQTIPGEDQAGLVLTQTGAPDRDSVLVNLVTYQEQ